MFETSKKGATTFEKATEIQNSELHTAKEELFFYQHARLGLPLRTISDELFLAN